jgi:hypothetical protein
MEWVSADRILKYFIKLKLPLNPLKGLSTEGSLQGIKGSAEGNWRLKTI